MPPKLDRGEQIQRKYYSDTASQYDHMHAGEGITEERNIRFVQTILRMVDARSVLDVGTATGRGLAYLKDAVPNAFVCGVEPVAAFVKQAVLKGNTASGPIVLGSGSALPFADGSFDVVCEFGVLHHVPKPNAVVTEMLRVAKKAAIIADSNRFGQGSRAARLIKLGLYKSKLWKVFDYVRTGGKGYRFTEGDGLSYSYSIYDSFKVMSRWADSVILYSGRDKLTTSWSHPVLNCPAAVLCALKESV